MSRAAAIELMLLSSWVGAALLVATVLAPAAFRVLPTRTMAGALIGQVLPVLFIAGLVIAVGAMVIEMRGDGRALRVPVLTALVVMLAGCAIAQLVIAPRIEGVRSAISGPLESLAEDDPLRKKFGRLHAFSVLWMGVAMAGAVATIVMKVVPAGAAQSPATVGSMTDSTSAIQARPE